MGKTTMTWKLSDVLDTFANGIEPTKKGEKISRVKVVAVDPQRDSVVFDIYTEAE